MLKIIRDTREKVGKWEFADAEIIVRKLESGDYSLDGLEDKVCIERKKSVTEMAINLGSDWTRFKKELERMKSIPFSYIICEFSLEDLLKFPIGTNIRPSLLQDVKMTGKYLVKLLSSFEKDYNIKVIYAGNRENAVVKAEEIFNTVQLLNE
jgi:ERCC4-type nuclease